MSGLYLKCDNCGAMLDRKPPAEAPNDGTWRHTEWPDLLKYAADHGWKLADRSQSIYEQKGNDLCPSCAHGQNVNK